MTTPDRPLDTPDAAAERLRPIVSLDRDCRFQWSECSHDQFEDLKEVARAYLALRAAGTPDIAGNVELYAAACRALEEAHDDPDEVDVRMLAEFVKGLAERQANAPRPPAGTPCAGPTVGEAYTRLAPWLRELDGPDLDNFYAAFARLRDEWQARTPDPSPAGDADLAAERLSDLVAYDPDMQLVLAEIPRLRAALARVEGELKLQTHEVGIWKNFADRSDKRIAVMADDRDEARQHLAAAEAKLAKLQAFKDWVHNYLDSHGVPHHPPGTHGAAGCRIGDRMDWVMAQLSVEVVRTSDDRVIEKLLTQLGGETARALTALVKERDQYKVSRDWWLQTAKAAEGYAAGLKAEVRLHRQKAEGNYWAWQGGGEDHLQSLICPVLIPVAELRELSAEREKRRAAEGREADDVEPVTPSWLGGPTASFEGGGNRVFVYIGYGHGDEQGRWCACINGSAFAHAVRVPTRGDVRRLCSALGTKLAAPAGPGEAEAKP